VCLVTVGGSGVGYSLLQRVVKAFPEAKRRVPDLRMIVVTGPRIDPTSLLPVVVARPTRPARVRTRPLRAARIETGSE
jgi:predicted glycosyltransferase